MMRLVAILFLLMAFHAPVAADDDFADVRDPFGEPPAVQKIETSVEQRPTTIDNMFREPSMEQASVMPPAAVMVPVQRAAPPVVSLPSLSVEGIIWGGGKPMAIIDGNVLAVGGTFKGVKIESIQRNGIDVVYKRKKFHIAADL